MYNMTSIIAANTWYELVVATNNLSNGFFFTFFMVILSISYWAIFKKKSFKQVFIAGSFFSAFLSVLLFSLQLVGKDFLILPFIMFFAGIIMFIFNNE